jgi:hypothetical protein
MSTPFFVDSVGQDYNNVSSISVPLQSTTPMQDLLHVLRASGVVVATMSGHTHNNGYVLDEVCKIVTCILFSLEMFLA